MRTLEFTTDSKERYDLIYEAFVASDRPMQAGDLRVCAKIFDKLETLGKPSAERASIFVFEKAGQIKLEEQEFTLLRDAMNQVRWNALGARRAAPVFEWLDSIKEDSIKLEK